MDGHPGVLPLIEAGAGQNPAYRPTHRLQSFDLGLYGVPPSPAPFGPPVVSPLGSEGRCEGSARPGPLLSLSSRATGYQVAVYQRGLQPGVAEQLWDHHDRDSVVEQRAGATDVAEYLNNPVATIRSGLSNRSDQRITGWDGTAITGPPKSRRGPHSRSQGGGTPAQQGLDGEDLNQASVTHWARSTHHDGEVVLASTRRNHADPPRWSPWRGDA
jgi:hypothetical protein